MKILLRKCKSPTFWISAAGLVVMVILFATWLTGNPGYSLSSRLSALTSAGLFTLLCLRFVPEWMRFWRFSPELPGSPSAEPAARSDAPRRTGARIFLVLLLLNALVLMMVFLLRRIFGYQESFVKSLEFWRCLDSGSYLNIAKNWYPTEGDMVVQLVFLPGYPVAIRLIDWLIHNELYSGLIVSALCFAGSGSMFYRLARLDHSHEDALRAIKYLCILPGIFFYTAPMTEGLFLLLSLSCLYCARTGKWTLGCLLGGLAAFTRSLGITLLVPLIMEFVHEARARSVDAPFPASRYFTRIASMLLVAAGLAAYLFINYQISGDPFKFQEYQSSHWGQHLGLFFNTAAYQLYQAIHNFSINVKTSLGLWWANLISCFGALLMMIYGAKKVRASYVAWFIAYFFVAIGTSWLLSAPRYLLVMFTLPLAMSSLTRNPDVDLAATPLCIMTSLLYLYAFVDRWQVW